MYNFSIILLFFAIYVLAVLVLDYWRLRVFGGERDV